MRFSKFHHLLVRRSIKDNRVRTIFGVSGWELPPAPSQQGESLPFERRAATDRRQGSVLRSTATATYSIVRFQYDSPWVPSLRRGFYLARLTNSSDLANHVLAPERIPHSNFAFRIVMPLAIHEEPIVMCSWLQLKTASPDTTGILPKVNWSFLPVGEVADQLDAQSRRCAICECLFMRCIVFL
jgi:hypothetical protein